MTYEGILFKIKAEEEKKVGHTFKLQWMKERLTLSGMYFNFSIQGSHQTHYSLKI